MEEQPVSVSDDVQIVGHTSGLVYTYVKGVISAERESEEGHHWYQVSAPAFRGNSGGGVFSKDGKLIGICSQLWLRAPNVIFFVDRDSILKFLKYSE
jgi:S1-C subfamily serine protease